MKPQKLIYLALFVFFAFTATLSCNRDDDNTNITPEDTLAAHLTYLPASGQRNGDPAAGRDYLIYGNYVASGIPYNTIGGLLPGDGNVLGRTGDNANLPAGFSAVNALNGVRVVAPNCLQCHGGYINGQFVEGLGNSSTDYTGNQAGLITIADLLITNTYGQNSPEWQAYLPFRTSTLKLSEILHAEVRGINLANNVFAVLASHRNPVNFLWSDEPVMPEITQMAPVDVPPWWHIQKKHALYYNGLGEGDFARLIMASNLLTVSDTSEARVVDNHFPDVYAYLKTLQPPPYPETINQTLAEQGRQVFNTNCARCHGTYGQNESYPNILVDLETIQTDPLLAEGYYGDAAGYVNWHAQSWFSEEPHSAALVPKRGYMAPPLDGIWATAPYFHNGSVPTVADVLNSTGRPAYWKRTFDSNDYNYEKLGWNHTVETQGGSTEVYNTTLEGHHNTGHTFGDKLNDTDRAALMEYLKTL